MNTSQLIAAIDAEISPLRICHLATLLSPKKKFVAS